jgi:MFS family permease
MRAAREALRHPPFGRLLAGYTVNQVGDYVGIVALSVLVYAETDSALATSGLFIAMQFLPALVSPALTARIDVYALRRSLPALYAAEALLFGILALLAENFVLWAVLLVAFLDGALMLTARGLLRAAVNSVLKPVGLVREGNGALNVGFALASVLGAALGGVLVETIGVAAALAVDGATFLLIAGLLAAARGLHAEHLEREPFRERLREGLRHAWEHPTLRLLIVGEGMAIVLFALVFPIEVIYARETLGTDETGYGILLASWGLGILIGSGLFLRSGRSLFALIALSTAAIGVAYAGMGLVDELWAACALSVIGGAGNGVQWVSVMTAVQESTTDDLVARVTGLLESVASAATGVGFLVGGVLTALTDPSIAFLAAGLGVIGIVLTGAAIRLGRGGPTPLRRPAAPSDGA